MTDGHRTPWQAAADWLGARKPLHLIFGAVLVIELVALLAHLA
jgi:hypothetical protein